MGRTLGIMVLIALAGLAAGCREDSEEAGFAEMARVEAQRDVEARNVETVRTVVAQLEKGEVGVFQRLFAPDFKLYYPSSSVTPVSREDAMGLAKMMVTAVPDLAYSVLDIFPAGDRVVLRLAFQGTHRAATEEKPYALTRIEGGALILFRLRDGLIVEEIIDGDALGLFRQLGLELRPKERGR